MKKFFMTAKGDTTLLDLLAENLPESCDAETVIEAGGVWHGERERLLLPHYRLYKGETVRVYVSPFQGRYYKLDSGQVVFEDEDLLAVYKPCNLNVHAVPSSLFYNLAYGVECYLKEQGLTIRPTPPTRLDRVVEGLVLFGKHRAAVQGLFRLVRQGRVKKWYLGALEKGSGIAHIRVQDTMSSSNGVSAYDPAGRRADTRFIRVNKTANADIYSIFPATGRRHQIRFHAAHYLTPIIGDRLYGARVSLKPDEIALLCRGYNIPWQGKNLKIRLPQERLSAFFQKLQRGPAPPSPPITPSSVANYPSFSISKTSSL